MCWCFDVSGEWCSTSSTCHSTFGHLQFKAHWKEFDSTSAFGGISLQPHGCLRVFEMGWSSTWHFPRLSERGSKWTCFGGVHWLWLGFRPCQQKVCKLLHCDVWKVLDIFGIKDSEDHFVVISWSRSFRLQQWSQWCHPTCQVVDMNHQQKNPYLHLHWQQWCQRNFESKGSWTFEALELPHLVVAGYGWEWNAEVMQHQRPFDSCWHWNETFSRPEKRSVMSLLGLYNRSNGWLEGAHDPGRVFVRRVNHRALAGALSLIQLHLQGCDSTLEGGNNNIFVLLFTLCVGVGMIWFFSWLARVSENLPEDAVLDEPTTNEIDDDEDGSIRMSHIGAAIIAANSEFPASNVASSSMSIPSGLAGADPIEMPVLRDENDLPEPHAAWSPEAMLTFIYSRCLRRRSTAVTLERQQLYEERLQLLCNVMNAC